MAFHEAGMALHSPSRRFYEGHIYVTFGGFRGFVLNLIRRDAHYSLAFFRNSMGVSYESPMHGGVHGAPMGLPCPC